MSCLPTVGTHVPKVETPFSSWRFVLEDGERTPSSSWPELCHDKTGKRLAAIQLLRTVGAMPKQAMCVLVCACAEVNADAA